MILTCGVENVQSVNHLIKLRQMYFNKLIILQSSNNQIIVKMPNMHIELLL